MDNVKEVVAKNATFYGASHLINTSIDKAGDKGKREESEIMNEGEVEEGEEEGNNDHTERARPFCVKVFANFSL